MSISFPNPLSPKEEKYYISLYESGDESARNILIEHNLRLVAHIAKKYANSAIPADDLISIGTIGLIKAVNTYRSHKSTRLATYAARCIDNEILMSLRASKRLRAEVSLSEPIGTDKEGNEINLNDIIGTDPDEILDDISLRIQTTKLLQAIDSVLTGREKTVIIKRYGIMGDIPLPQREVAKELNISRSYVSRIEKKAISKLKAQLKNEITVFP